MRHFNRCVVFAYSEIGCACLETLLSMGADVAAVFTHEDDPNEEIWFRSVASEARKNGIPVLTDSPRDKIDFIRSLEPDLIFSFYYRSIIPNEVVELPPGGAYNMHGSLLPKFRGRAPINWAIIMGETETGVTLHHMTSEPDKGDIVDQETVTIGFVDTAIDLFAGAVEAAKTVMLRSYPLIASGVAPRQAQDESQATTFGRRTPADGLIDWRKSAREIYNLVRGVTHPFPGAFSWLEREGEVRRVFIWRAWPLDTSSSMGKQPGTVVSLVPLCVATGKGVLRLESLESEGQGEVPAASFVGMEGIRPGTRFQSERPAILNDLYLNVLILGAGGFIGTHLSEAILAGTPWRITAFDRDDANIGACLQNERYSFVKGNIFKDDEWLRKAVKEADVVLPLAGVAKPGYYIEHPLETYELDFEQNLKIIRMCVDEGKRVIFPSTSEVYGICGESELFEDESSLVLGPVSKQRWIYSCSKQLLDRVIAAYGQQRGLDYTIFRPFNWVGPRLDSFEDARARQARSITQFVHDAYYRGEILLVDGGKSRRSFLWVGDAMEALIAVIRNEGGHASRQIFNIGNPDNNVSMRELAETVLRVMGEFGAFETASRNTILRDMTAEEFYGEGYQDTPDRRPSIVKIRAALGWAPRTNLEVTVRRTLAYFANRL